jgi:hypothetical protein
MLQKILPRRIDRLDKHIQYLQARGQRYTWVRLGVLLGGGALTWMASKLLGEPWGWIAVLGSLIIFLGVALSQRRLDGWIETLQTWRVIKAEQLARVNLDWDRIPTPALPIQSGRTPLEIDLDLTGLRSIHHLVDWAVSIEGSTRLANWLSKDNPNIEEIESRQQIVRELVPKRLFRERFSLSFRQVSQDYLDGNKLLLWLNEDLPTHRPGKLLPLATTFTILNLILFLMNGFGLLAPYWILSIPIYLLFYYWNARVLEPFMGAIVRLDEGLEAFSTILRQLENDRYYKSPNLERLCAPFLEKNEHPSTRMRRVKLVTAAVGLRMNPIFALLLNIFLPWDLIFATLAARYREQLAQVLPTWLETLYELEALISLANFADLNPDYSFPRIKSDSSPAFQAEAIGHPLIPPEEKIRNDFMVDEVGQITIITGSNMAGKSTFIKTLGVNLCLAYAGGPVNARIFCCLPYHLHTCIRISDSITDGFSYFYAEVKCLKTLLGKLRSDSPWPLLYLVDEIFRGTNNRERLIGSRAYIQALIGERGVGFLATHDLELVTLAEGNEQVRNFHFRDQVQGDRLIFDYTIRPGPSPTTNALKIMEMEGLPVEGGQ